MEAHKMEKWGTKLTIKFLKKYREHRCLWDFNDPDYKNRIARTKALEEIVAFMALNNFDVRCANVKIKALRSTYLHEKRKIRKSAKIGISYRPKLAWYPLADNFLRNFVMEKFCLMGTIDTDEHELREPSKTASPQQVASKDGKIGATNATEPSISTNNLAAMKTNATSNVIHVNKRIHEYEPGTSKTNSIQQPVMVTPSTPSTQRQTGRNQIQTGMVNVGEVPENNRYNSNVVSNLVHCNNTTDEFDAFGTSIAAQMRTLPLNLAYEIQLQIQCLITQTKLKVLAQQSSTTVDSSDILSRNWNSSNHNSNEGHIRNLCNGEIKVEDIYNVQGNITTSISPSNERSDASNCYNIPEAEKTEVEDCIDDA